MMLHEALDDDPAMAIGQLPRKLMLVKLRDDWLALDPDRSLGEFHDAFLGYGNPPLRLLRQAMLGTADDGRLFAQLD